jgi:hypothetical protein
MLISNPSIGGIFVGIVLSSVLVFRALGFHKRGLPR